MKVSVKFFASYREAAGEGQIELELNDGASLGELLSLIYDKYPKLKNWAESIVCSVNKKYADADLTLKGGDEVALLPPVSGGSGVDEDFHIEDMLASLKTEGTGAVVFFVGVVRKDPGVQELSIESYPEMVEEKMDELAQKAKGLFRIEKMEMIHRTGTLAIGENIVVIGVSAPHRKDAFEACRWGVDELKKIVPIWKKDEGGWIGQDD